MHNYTLIALVWLALSICFCFFTVHLSSQLTATTWLAGRLQPQSRHFGPRGCPKTKMRTKIAAKVRACLSLVVPDFGFLGPVCVCVCVCIHSFVSFPHISVSGSVFLRFRAKSSSSSSNNMHKRWPSRADDAEFNWNRYDVMPGFVFLVFVFVLFFSFSAGFIYVCFIVALLWLCIFVFCLFL